MHMRLPSLRACRYIAERKDIPNHFTGLAAAAWQLYGALELKKTEEISQ